MTMPTGNDSSTALQAEEPPVAGLTVRVREAGPQAAVCALDGDLDIESLAPTRQALDDLVARSLALIVVDLEHVAFCDSSGLNLLLKTRLAANAAGADFRLASPSPTVRRVLELTGADTVFAIHSGVDDALAASR